MESPAEQKVELTPEQQLQEQMKVIDFHHNLYRQLIAVHVANFANTMMSTNRVTFNEKIQARDALIEALQAAHDFGVVEKDKLKLRQTGKWAKEVNQLTSLLVKSVENKTLIMAYNYEEKEKNGQTSNNGQETTGNSEATTETGDSSENGQ